MNETEPKLQWDWLLAAFLKGVVRVLLLVVGLATVVTLAVVYCVIQQLRPGRVMGGGGWGGRVSMPLPLSPAMLARQVFDSLMGDSDPR